jgi:hypothetical protein
VRLGDLVEDALAVLGAHRLQQEDVAEERAGALVLDLGVLRFVERARGVALGEVRERLAVFHAPQ